MAVDITLHELLPAMRLTASITETPNVTIANIVLNMLDVATAQIEAYSPDAPVPTQNESAIRFCIWMYDVSPAEQQRRMASQNGFKQSGAMAMLSSWHIPQAVVVI